MIHIIIVYWTLNILTQKQTLIILLLRDTWNDRMNPDNLMAGSYIKLLQKIIS